MKYILTVLLLIGSFYPNWISAQIPTYVPNSNLIGWYPFSGNANDLSINNNHGSVNNAFLDLDRYNQIDKAYYFDGSQITINNILPSNNSFSVSLWSNNYSNTGALINCLQDDGFGNFQGFWIGFYNGYPQVFLGDGSSTVGNYDGNTYISDGNWHSMALSYDGSNVNFYVDGIIDLSFNYSIMLPSAATNVIVGNDNYGNNFNGLIDDIGIWSSAITQQQVSELHNGCSNNLTYNISSCANYTSPSGQLYTQSGTYYETVYNQDGCDSLITINLTITATDFNGISTTVTQPSCQAPNDGSIEVDLNSTIIQGDFFFISEYYSGLNSNKAIEIYNATNSTIDLGANYGDPSQSYTLFFKLKNNLNQTYSFPPNTLIEPHSTILISNPLASLNADLTTPIIDGSIITLFYDVIEFGIQENYDIAQAVNGQTRIRKNSVNVNNAFFDINEWDTYALSPYSLGTHGSNQYYVDWSNGNIGPSLSNLSPGIYTYNVIGSLNGCTIPFSVELTGAVFNDFNDTVCNGTTYIWNGQTYENEGVYEQILTNQFGCDSIVTLHLNHLYNDPINVVANMTFGVSPFVVAFNNLTSNADNYNFTLNFGDSTSIESNEQYIAHIYSDTGYYNLTIEAENLTTGCISTIVYEDLIYVLSNPLSIEEQNNSKVSIFPNPSLGSITIDVNSQLLGKKYSIMDFTGRIILNGTIHQPKTKIDLSNLEIGTYFVQIDGDVKNHKILKR